MCTAQRALEAALDLLANATEEELIQLGRDLRNKEGLITASGYHHALELSIRHISKGIDWGLPR